MFEILTSTPMFEDASSHTGVALIDKGLICRRVSSFDQDNELTIFFLDPRTPRQKEELKKAYESSASSCTLGSSSKTNTASRGKL